MSLIVWVMLYGLIYQISEEISGITGIHHSITILSMFIYWTALFCYLNKRGYAKIYNICFPKYKKLSRYIVYIPLILMPVFNVIVYVHRCFGMGTDTKMQNVSILSAFNLLISFLMTMNCAVGEEVLFRGVLLVIFIRRYKMRVLGAIVSTSLIFAGMHVCNIFVEGNWYYVLIQMINACLVGFCLAVVSIRENSIALSIIVHFMFNISSMSIESGDVVSGGYALSGVDLKIFMIQPMIYAMYGIWLYQTKNRNT